MSGSKPSSLQLALFSDSCLEPALYHGHRGNAYFALMQHRAGSDGARHRTHDMYRVSAMTDILRAVPKEWDYLERERAGDAGESVSDEATALFLSATCLSARSADGRLSVRAINLILEQIGRWHDAEVRDPARRISPLRPHDLRHTFAFQLAKRTGADAYELERRLGHRSQRYIQRYTNPPEDVAAGYIEEF